jgi:hypothetical protein
VSANLTNRALKEACHFLTERQSPDGAWRSDIYGVFKEGDALTPLVAHVLLTQDGPRDNALLGLGYLAGKVGSEGNIDEGRFGLAYPVYTAGLAVRGFCRLNTAQGANAARAWLHFLQARQLTEERGWLPTDPDFGGWGYCQDLPRKPAHGLMPSPHTESNLSATATALDAVRAAQCMPNDSVVSRALLFVQRCQNFSAVFSPKMEPPSPEPEFDDGGFFFIHGDPHRNKAGIAGSDDTGRQRFRSYGSMTADGLRCLLACGLPLAHPRVQAALNWLGRHFTVTHHPGRFPRERAAVQAAVFFYYCWSLAEALRAAGVAELETPAGPVRWADELTAELLRRQNPDGSWINHAVEVREDDPIVATALALGALAAANALYT